MDPIKLAHNKARFFTKLNYKKLDSSLKKGVRPSIDDKTAVSKTTNTNIRKGRKESLVTLRSQLFTPLHTSHTHWFT